MRTVGPRSLIRVMALGAVITLTAGTGIFALFSDQAKTGFNDVQSGERPPLALKLAEATVADDGSVACGEFVDDLTTGLFAASNLQPGDAFTRHVCLENTFPASLTASMSALDLVSYEIGCSGSEPQVDPSCTPVVGQLRVVDPEMAGELDGVLDLEVMRYDCISHAGVLVVNAPLSTLAAGPVLSLGSIDAGATVCLQVRMSYPETTTELQQQRAQTDEAEWRLAFDATE